MEALAFEEAKGVCMCVCVCACKESKATMISIVYFKSDSEEDLFFPRV